MNVMDLNGGELPTDFASEKRWSDQFIPRIRQIIGPHLLRVSSLSEDATQATDLIVLKAEGLRIACRVRHAGYAQRWGGEITITCRRENGHACEYDKMILGGWSDWFFYAHAPNLLPRVLVDLDKARPVIVELVENGTIQE